MAIELRPANDDDVPAIVALIGEADDARVLTEESRRYMRRTEPETAHLLELVATDSGKVVACGTASLNTSTSEPGAAWASVTVSAVRRGEGIGSRIGEALLDHLRTLDASKVTTFVRFTEESERWAAARGWSRALAGPLIALDPRSVPAPELPAGFRCAPLSAVPPEAVFVADCEAALDEPVAVPNDRFEFAEFLREWENPIIDLESSAAVLDGDRVAAFTFLKVAGDRGQHGFTGTARDYRGRGLATAAKRYALRAAAARGVVRVTTSNAEQNLAMRAINRRLGFEPIGEQGILAKSI